MTHLPTRFQRCARLLQVIFMALVIGTLFWHSQISLQGLSHAGLTISMKTRAQKL